MMFSILSCVCLTFRCFHWLKNLFKPFAHFLKIWFFLSYSSVFGVFAYSGYKSLIYMFRIFFVSLCHVFIFSICFYKSKRLYVGKIQFLNFFFFVLCFVLWETIACPKLQRFSPVYFTRNFIVLSFILLWTEYLCPVPNSYVEILNPMWRF